MPMDDGDGAAGRSLGRARERRPATADRPGPLAVRPQAVRRAAVRTAAGRARAAGRRSRACAARSARRATSARSTSAPTAWRRLRWIRAQPWHAERIGMIGPSYLGLVQWAVAPDAGDDLAALSIQVSASQFHGQTYAGGSLSLETSASWLVLVAEQERRFAPLAIGPCAAAAARAARRAAARATSTSAPPAPRSTGFARGSRIRLATTPTGWRATTRRASRRSRRRCSSSAAGTTSSCRGCSRTSRRCRRPATHPQLIIGPWTHTVAGAAGGRDRATGSPGCARTCSTTTGSCVARAVRVFVTGERGRRRLARAARAGRRRAPAQRRLWLADDGALERSASAGAGVRRRPLPL